MTNKDKFLRDGVSVEEFIQKLTNHINKTQKSTYEKIKEFLEQPAQILTEDERVILWSIDHDLKYIHRSNELLYFSCEKGHKLWLRSPFGYSKFQFIKEGEEYSIQELLGDDQ